MLTIATGKEVALLLFHTPTKYGSDRFRQIFIDHWAQWWDYRQEEIPADLRAYVQKMVEKMMGYRKFSLHNKGSAGDRQFWEIIHEEI